jgi:hypothetical protein
MSVRDMKAELKRSNFALTLGHEMSTLSAPLDRQIPLSKHLCISQSGLALYISGRRRPDDASLRNICARWPDRDGAQRLLLAHLRDQIEIAGLTDAGITITAKADAATDPQLTADLELLTQEAGYRPQIKPLIHNLADMIRASYIAQEVSGEPAPRLLAAKSPATYTTKRDAIPSTPRPTAGAASPAKMTGAAGRKPAR